MRVTREMVKDEEIADIINNIKVKDRQFLSYSGTEVAFLTRQVEQKN